MCLKMTNLLFIVTTNSFVFVIKLKSSLFLLVEMKLGKLK